MKLILCNDDGALSEGASSLCVALSNWGAAAGLANKITTLGAFPSGNHSGCGSRITIRGWLSNESSPLDCLRRALHDFKPGWVLAGLNDGANIGRMIMCSGTVCLAAYAAEEGIPAMALSQHRPLVPDKPNFSHATERLGAVFEALLKRPPPPGAFYNVNLPMARSKFLGVIGCAERGTGGYIPELVDGREFVTKWVAKSEPERLLERGYAVVQLIEAFKAIVPEIDGPKGGLEKGRCARNPRKSGTKGSCR